MEHSEAILIRRTLRSGQKVTYHGDVVVMGDVNPGAEIIAGGNIIVLGALRGVAHAGAEGDEGAVVAAFRLQALQLRIAGHIGRAPDDLSEDAYLPEVARVEDGKVIVAAYP